MSEPQDPKANETLETKTQREAQEKRQRDLEAAERNRVHAPSPQQKP